MQFSKRRAVGAAAAAAMLLTAPTATRAADADHKADWAKLHILLVPWSQSSNPFFEALVNGAKDAASQQGVNLEVQFGEEDQNREKTILETAVANKVDAIAVNIADDNAYKDIMC